MHPRMMGYWPHHHSHHRCSHESGCCAPGSERWEHHHHSGGEYGAAGMGGGPFNVRRPLRFLAWKLQLDEAQVEQLATILNELKTERAQAAVDDRRSLTAFADAVGGETFDEARAGEAAAQRAKSVERLQGTVAKALSRIHALLNPDQRGRLAYLIRTGALLL